MRALAGAVTVLTTVHEGRRWGLTATAVCSLSADPPRLLACVNQRGTTFAALDASRRLAVNVLAHEHFPVAERFAGVDRVGEDRFGRGAWRDGAGLGLPVLEGAIAVFECRVGEIIDAASHGILVCDIVHVETTADGAPLLYCDGRFTTLAENLVDPRYGHHF
jgi:flavin reductase (DIM6/NTAB) family NADH-FMN oxidoreductase RutF